MNKSKLIIALAAAGLSFSQVATADDGGSNWSISGWINEAMIYYDDGVGSDIVQASDNGTTLGSRIVISGSTELPSSDLTAGFEVIIEPNQSNNTPLIFSNQATFGDANGHTIGILGNSVNVGGSFGKLTVGLQSMPTDNIAVLADPSLTLWSTIPAVFRGNGFTIQGLGAGATNTVWGSFLQCATSNVLTGIAGIGIDCNGIYRNGVRYDLPAFDFAEFGSVSVAVGYANDDIYDIAAKYAGEVAGLTSLLNLGYAKNANGGAAAYGGDGSKNFQVQAGLMDPGTGIFGALSYQYEDIDSAAVGASDDTNAWWTKVGVKKAFNSLGDTAITFQYGMYKDQYGTAADVTGSEVTRMGVSVDQYFGSRLIIYGIYESLELDVDCTAGTTCSAMYGGAEDLDIFSAGLTFFF